MKLDVGGGYFELMWRRERKFRFRFGGSAGRFCSTALACALVQSGSCTGLRNRPYHLPHLPVEIQASCE